MADGVDGAADAFRTAIAPGSQPRDTGGRFASTPSRPETMFNPRPIEGDPLTGDTRDGGEDARLAAAERRIADGRAEEGDENVRSRTRRAPAEGEGENEVVAEELQAGARSAVMPPPTSDTTTTQGRRMTTASGGAKSSKIQTMTGQTSTPRPRAMGGTPRGTPSATPRPGKGTR